jgi:hypothetical protein
MNTLPNDPLGGTIGQGQYDNWRARFGEMTPGAGQSIGSVPEPHTIGLLVAVIVAGMVARRRNYLGKNRLTRKIAARYSQSWPDGRMNL